MTFIAYSSHRVPVVRQVAADKILLAKLAMIASRPELRAQSVAVTAPPSRNTFSDDDYVGFFLATFKDQRKAFEMFFNPPGFKVMRPSPQEPLCSLRPQNFGPRCSMVEPNSAIRE